MLLLTTGNWKSLLLGSDSVLHALVGIANSIVEPYAHKGLLRGKISLP